MTPVAQMKHTSRGSFQTFIWLKFCQPSKKNPTHVFQGLEKSLNDRSQRAKERHRVSGISRMQGMLISVDFCVRRGGLPTFSLITAAFNPLSG